MKINVKKLLLWLVIAFVIVSIYNNPEDSGDSVGAFLGDVGSFASTVVDRTAAFIGGLGE